MKKNSTLTVIIPTYNRYERAVRLARKIRSLDRTTEVIIINQGIKEELPTNSSVSVLHQKYPNLPRARNLGIKKAKGKIIVFFDDDVKLTKNTLPSHLKAYKDTSTIAVAGRVINHGEKLPQNLNVETGKTNKLASTFLYRFFSTRKQYVDFPYGCNMSFRKSVFNKIGYFDENFRPPLCAFEELDIAARVRKFGKIKFIPKALVFHLRSKTGGARVSSDKKMSLYYQSFGYYLAKNLKLYLGLFSLLIRSYHSMREAPYAIPHLYRGYFFYFKKALKVRYEKISKEIGPVFNIYLTNLKPSRFFDKIRA